MTGSWSRPAPGWRIARAAGGQRGVTLRMLAARFPQFAFGTRRMRDHVSFEAVRCDDAPGVAVVITDDMGELRQALQEDEGLSGDGPDG